MIQISFYLDTTAEYFGDWLENFTLMTYSAMGTGRINLQNKIKELFEKRKIA